MNLYSNKYSNNIVLFNDITILNNEYLKVLILPGGLGCSSFLKLLRKYN